MKEVTGYLSVVIFLGVCFSISIILFIISLWVLAIIHPMRKQTLKQKRDYVRNTVFYAMLIFIVYTTLVYSNKFSLGSNNYIHYLHGLLCVVLSYCGDFISDKINNNLFGTDELNVSNVLSEANQTTENQESEEGKEQKPDDRSCL